MAGQEFCLHRFRFPKNKTYQIMQEIHFLSYCFLFIYNNKRTSFAAFILLCTQIIINYKIIEVFELKSAYIGKCKILTLVSIRVVSHSSRIYQNDKIGHLLHYLKAYAAFR